MQVGCAHIDSIYQHFVKEADNGRIFCIHAVSVVHIGGIRIFDCGNVVKIEVGASREFFQAFTEAGSEFGEQIGQLGIFHYYPINGQLRGKFDFLCGNLVAGVGRGDDEAPPFFGKRQQLALHSQLDVQQVFADFGFIDRRDIQQRHGKRLCQGIGHVGGIDMPGA